MVTLIARRRLSFAVLWIALAALLGACGAPEIALTGTVTDAYTNQPVPSATITLAGNELTTDAAGRYQIAKWNIKDTLQVSADGYEPSSVALESQPGLAKPAPPAATLDVAIRPNTLTGSVTDSHSGRPIAGASVQAGETISATTDAEGRYTLAGVPEQFTLTVTAPDHEPVSQSLHRTTSFDTAVRPNVLTGLITDEETGRPIAGATVMAGDVTATTGADGRYRLEGAPQDATAEVDAEGYAAASRPLGQMTSLDLALRPDVLTGAITDEYTGAPIAGATVAAGEARATTGADGRYRLEGVAPNSTVQISAEGYAESTRAIQTLAPLDAALRPDVLRGTLVDGESGAPIKFATVIATQTLNSSDVAFARIDNSPDGTFTLESIPEQGYLQVLAPGYRKTTVELKPGEVPPAIQLEPFQVRAAYITAAVASAGPDLVNEYLDLIDRTELNTLVVDLKSDLRDDLGLVYYDSQVPIVRELGTSADYVDLPALLAETKKRGIYTIARVQVFSHDNALADARPDWAIKDRETGEVFADYPGPGIRYAWLDPWNRHVWDYNIQLSVEAAHMGFDEINFDYIRYPDWSDLETYDDALLFSQPTDPATDPEPMFANLATFMEQSQRAINGAGAFFSIDVFGRVMLKPAVPIAQDIARMAQHADYICPMPYPSLWWPTYLGFDNPTAHPYEVILGSLQSAAPYFEGRRALLRPWLQDHTDPWQGARVVEYGPREVRAQIDATEDFGKAAGWMLYDSANTYTEGALKPAQ